MDLSELTPADIGTNLGNPEGDVGKAVGHWMNKFNMGISKAAYALLNLQGREHVLEIGAGNGALIEEMVSPTNSVSYVGIDISPTMLAEATERNETWIANGRVALILCPVEALTLPENTFDCAVAVNSIYFWDAPKALRELHRVLKQGGMLVVASNTPETMLGNPFAKKENGFRNILSKDALTKLHRDAGFSDVSIEDWSEPAKRQDGTPYLRTSNMVLATK